MRPSIDLVRTALELGKPERLPRGELWVNSEVLEKAGLMDTPEGHVVLRKRLGMDLLSLPLSYEEGPAFSQDYRYFNLDEVREAVRLSDLFVMAVLDGPFERLTAAKGLMAVLGKWKESKEALKDQFSDAGKAVRHLIEPCIRAGIECLVLADDLAYSKSSYFSPKDFEEVLLPFYSSVVEAIHSGGARALFHSCGNIGGLIPQLRSIGFDGFAACQSRLLEGALPSEEHPTVILGGIEPEHLELSRFDKRHRLEFQRSVQALASGGGVILCSSCGLFKPEYLDRIRLLYEMVEGWHDHF